MARTRTPPKPVSAPQHGRIKRTPEKDAAFFGSLATTGHVIQSGAAAGYAHTSLYEWRAADEDFAARWERAIKQSIERMEREADRRGIEGTLKPVFYQGVECGQIREYSDTLLIFRLKALDPDKYRERAAIEHTGKDGKDLIPAEQPVEKTALALLALLEAARAKDESGAGND